MKLSTDRILTTHVGSFPRPQEVVDFLFAQDRGEPIDPVAFDEVMGRGVSDAVGHQTNAGLDILDDGEMSKISYGTYIRHRLSGFEPGDVPRATPADLDDFPEYRDKLAASGSESEVFASDLQGADRSQEPAAAARRHRPPEGRVVGGVRAGGFHDRGVARDDRGVPAE